MIGAATMVVQHVLSVEQVEHQLPPQPADAAGTGPRFTAG